MATRQETSKPQEQTKQPAEQAKQPEPKTRPSETAMTPHCGGAMTHSGGWAPLVRLHDDFDRLFDQLSRGMFGMPTAHWDSGWGIDMREDEHNILVRAEAPGFEPSDFDI